MYLESNRDDCTVSLIYAVHLEKQGSVSFTYQYPDNNIFFEFYVSPPPRAAGCRGYTDAGASVPVLSARFKLARRWG